MASGLRLRGIKPGIITVQKAPHQAVRTLSCPLAVSGGTSAPPAADGCSYVSVLLISSGVLADVSEQLKLQQQAGGEADEDPQNSSHIV